MGTINSCHLSNQSEFTNAASKMQQNIFILKLGLHTRDWYGHPVEITGWIHILCLLATGGVDKTVLIWTPEKKTINDCSLDHLIAHSLQWHRMDNLFFSGSEDKTVKLTLLILKNGANSGIRDVASERENWRKYLVRMHCFSELNPSTMKS